jgi:hypothetical protein
VWPGARPRDSGQKRTFGLAFGSAVVPTRGVVGNASGLDSGERNSVPLCCLPVLRLLIAWIGRRDVEAWISQKLVDGGGIGSDPGPMRVDVVGDTPGVVGWPDERGVPSMQSGLTRPHLGCPPVAKVGYRLL